MIKTIMYNKALDDPRLRLAIARLKLGKDSAFSRQHEAAKKNPQNTKRVRLFYVEGPKNSVTAILLANFSLFRGEPGVRGKIPIGVFVSPKYRRCGLASSLVKAARKHYPRSTLYTEAWDKASMLFWHKLVPITKNEPAIYDHTLNEFLPEGYSNDLVPT